MFLELKIPIITHSAAWDLRESKMPYICIRHDVDRNIDTALAMARIESDLNIVSTYYLLPPGDYNSNENYYGVIDEGQIRISDHTRAIALEMQSLGHEIGLHNDFVQLGEKANRDVCGVILEQIKAFSEFGVTIRGSASHGSKFARAYQFVNYEIFSDTFSPSRLRRSLILPNMGSLELFSIDMNSVGLDYEAYHIKRDSYISDTGSILNFDGDVQVNISRDYFFKSMKEKKRIIALFHPEWWKSRPLTRLNSLEGGKQFSSDSSSSSNSVRAVDLALPIVPFSMPIDEPTTKCDLPKVDSDLSLDRRGILTDFSHENIELEHSKSLALKDQGLNLAHVDVQTLQEKKSYNNPPRFQRVISSIKNFGRFESEKELSIRILELEKELKQAEDLRLNLVRKLEIQNQKVRDLYERNKEYARRLKEKR